MEHLLDGSGRLYDGLGELLEKTCLQGLRASRQLVHAAG